MKNCWLKKENKKHTPKTWIEILATRTVLNSLLVWWK